MILYLDTSVIVALFVADPFNERADHLVKHWRSTMVVSNFAAAEMASAISRRVRMNEVTRDEAQTAFERFDTWTAATVVRTAIEPTDVAAATTAMRGLDLSLRTGDAIHIAASQRLGAILATFDRKMAHSAQALDIVVVTN